MSSNSVVEARNRLSAAWKLFLSLFKRDWELSDYPVVLREHEVDPNHAGNRLKPHRSSAAIVNWWVVTGGGDTEREALQELEKAFGAVKSERANAKERLPRPGRHVPIEFASQQRVNAHAELADDFVRRVLALDWAFISDASSLWDFHHAETNEALIARIKEVYGVDVSDIESARLSEILERIASTQPSA
ncbi:MAG: hypothetical protein WBD45_21415 [Terriglobales bacterium]